MAATAADQELAMTVLCGLPCKYEQLIVAINASADDEKVTLKFIKSRLIHEEQRITERSKSPNKKPDLALIGRTDNRNYARQVSLCFHCNHKGHSEPKRLQKCPRWAPGHKPFGAEAIPHNDKADSNADNENFVCLLDEEYSVCPQWATESGPTSHMCCQEDRSVELEKVSPFSIKNESSSNATYNGRETVSIKLAAKTNLLILF